MRKLLYPLGYVLLLPLWLTLAVAVLMHLMIKALTWLSHGMRFHVYFRIMQAIRWLRSKPTWQPVDLRIGIGPPGRLPTVDEVREAFPGGTVVAMEACGEPDCENCNPKKED